MSEDTGVIAVRGMSDLSSSIVLGLSSDMRQVIARQEHVESLIVECNDLTKMLTKKVMELSNEVREMRKLLHDPTVDALTAPLLEMQDKSKRRRERSAAMRSDDTRY